jgi:hypothetical protein
MQLYVLPCDWGETQLNDIERVLKDTASHLNQLLRNPFEGIIHVKSLPLDADPYTPYVEWREPLDEPFVIWLAVLDPDGHDRDWCKYAYQFSHEFCHVLSDYNSLKGNPNNWFHESICELASVFTLRCMAETWTTNPPYCDPAWASYAQAFRDYAQKLLLCPKRNLPEAMTLPDWLSSHEESLREKKDQRNKNAAVAYSLLSLFENHRAGWNAIQSLPDCSGSLKEYFTAWHSCADAADKDFIACLSKAFDYTLG